MPRFRLAAFTFGLVCLIDSVPRPNATRSPRRAAMAIDVSSWLIDPTPKFSVR